MHSVLCKYDVALNCSVFLRHKSIPIVRCSTHKLLMKQETPYQIAPCLMIRWVAGVLQRISALPGLLVIHILVWFESFLNPPKGKLI